MKYWGMSRCVDFWAVQGATREHTPRGSVTEDQRSTAQKAAQPSGPRRRKGNAVVAGRASRGQLGPSGGVTHSLQPHKGDARRSRPATAGPKLASRGIPQYFIRLPRRGGGECKSAAGKA